MSSCERSDDADLSQSPHHHGAPPSTDNNSKEDGKNQQRHGGDVEDGESLLRNFTLQQLAHFNGQLDDTIPKKSKRQPEPKPVYVSLKGMVFDVSEGRQFYGPGGPYEMLAGRECGLALAKMNIEDATLLDNFELSYTEEEETKLNRWIHKFQNIKQYPLLGRLIPPSQLPNPERILTRDNLTLYNGESLDIPEGYAVAPIYLGVDGIVFDVSFGGVDFYGPGGPYQKFAGKDVSRALAKLSLDMEVISNINVDDLTEKEIQTMKDWKSSFQTKRLYPIVGRLSLN